MKKNSLLPYFCTNCKQVVDTIDQAFVLEQKSSKYFCSEKCIVVFHKPHIDFFQKQEQQWRQELKIENDSVKVNDLEQQKMVESILKEPQEVWIIEDSLGMEYCCLKSDYKIKKDTISLVVICHLFIMKPSFIFHHVFTKNKNLVAKYRWGKKIDLLQGAVVDSDNNKLQDEVLLSKDLMQELERMRSQLLSELIIIRTDNDIPLENFSEYEKYMEGTIENPDESFEYKTHDGQKLLVHISDQQEKTKSFYYFVISMKLSHEDVSTHAASNNKINNQYPMIVPVIAFPSVEQHVYQYYKKGFCVNKRSLN